MTPKQKLVRSNADNSRQSPRQRIGVASPLPSAFPGGANRARSQNHS